MYYSTKRSDVKIDKYRWRNDYVFNNWIYRGIHRRLVGQRKSRKLRREIEPYQMVQEEGLMFKLPKIKMPKVKMPDVVGKTKDLGSKIGGGIKSTTKGATKGIKKLNPFKK